MMYLIIFALYFKEKAMSETQVSAKEFSIDMVPEPENIEDVIYSLMVNPNLISQ